MRLVTLTGPGSTGNTRLALQAAADLLDATEPPPALPLRREKGLGGEGHFPDSVYFVNLAPIGDPNPVASAIAQTLGLTEMGGQPLAERWSR